MPDYNKDELLGLYDLGPRIWEEYRSLEMYPRTDVTISFESVEEAEKFRQKGIAEGLRKQEIEEMVMRKALKDIDPREEDYSPEDPTLKKCMEVCCLWYVKKFAAYLEKEDY